MAGVKTLFVFLDESGNLDFSPKGTAYWSLTALCTFDPVLGRDAFTRMIYELAAEGSGIEYFHATEDRQQVRDLVFDAILKLGDGFEIHSILAEKRKAHPSLYRRFVLKKGNRVPIADQTEFYKLVCRTLLKYVINRPAYQCADRFVIVLSSLFTQEKHSQIEGALKAALRALVDKKFHIYFRQNKADINCQLADYCGWAVTVAWERKELRSLDLIRPKVKSQFDLFKRGADYFY
jgi:Protein of unknown function (DUF3800)